MMNTMVETMHTTLRSKYKKQNLHILLFKLFSYVGGIRTLHALVYTYSSLKPTVRTISDLEWIKFYM